MALFSLLLGTGFSSRCEVKVGEGDMKHFSSAKCLILAHCEGVKVLGHTYLYIY